MSDDASGMKVPETVSNWTRACLSLGLPRELNLETDHDASTKPDETRLLTMSLELDVTLAQAA